MSKWMHCGRCGNDWEEGLLGFGGCPRCFQRDMEKREEKERHAAEVAESREHAERLAEQQERRDRAAQQEEDRRHEERLEAEEATRQFLEEQERERQRLEDDRETARRTHETNLADRQREDLFYATLRQSRFGRARDDLDMAIAQRPYDVATAETALRSAVVHWPGYA